MYKDKKNILFDLDGTIIESKEGITNCIIETLTHFNYKPPSKNDLDWCIGPPLHDCYRILTNTQDANHLEEIINYSRQIYSEKWIYECSIYPGMMEVITNLKKDKNVYIATSKPRVFAEKTMEHFGITNYFNKIFGSEFDGKLENKEELIAHILKDQNISASDSIMIGDRKFDILGARANNMQVIAVTWGFADMDEFETHVPDYICEHITDLNKIL
jgi:phosphoglycolate phosphatase